MSQKRRILLVDDLNDVVLIQSALAGHNLPYERVVVHDGAEALDYLFRLGKFSARNGPPPDLILLDIKMPRVDGFEVLQTLKANATLKVVPVVVFTSSDQEKDRLKSYQLGANAYVVKPSRYEEFLRSVQTICAFWAVVNRPPPASGWNGDVTSQAGTAGA